MQLIRRRFSPSLILAGVALFVALAGTATAAVIVSSPDQLADGVVSEPKLASDAVIGTKIRDHAVRQNDLTDPALRFSVTNRGTLRAGDGAIAHTKGSNRYDITPTLGDLGNQRLNACAFTATPAFDFTQAPGHNGHLNPRAYVNFATDSLSFQVLTFEQLQDGSEVPAEASFDVVMAC
jgi:hypothetical protein